MTPDGQPEGNGVTAFRLKSLEERMVSLSKHVDDRFDKLDARLSGLGYVRADLYQRDREEMKAEIQANRSLMWRTLFAVLGVVLAALVTVAIASLGA